MRNQIIIFLNEMKLKHFVIPIYIYIYIYTKNSKLFDWIIIQIDCGVISGIIYV